MSICLLYTSDAADEGLGVDLGGRRIIKKKLMIMLLWSIFTIELRKLLSVKKELII